MKRLRAMACGPAAGWACFASCAADHGAHGIDRVPVELEGRYRWFTPWRYWHIGKAPKAAKS
jgi:hypothetical protein